MRFDNRIHPRAGGRLALYRLRAAYLEEAEDIAAAYIPLSARQKGGRPGIRPACRDQSAPDRRRDLRHRTAEPPLLTPLVAADDRRLHIRLYRNEQSTEKIQRLMVQLNRPSKQ